MNLSEALEPLKPVMGMSSVIGALMSGDISSIAHDTVTPSLDEVTRRLEKAKHDQEHCGSDYAYWGYEGEIAYLTAVRDILVAADLVGPENLPDVKADNFEDGVVMDIYSRQERYGAEVLRQAKQSIVDSEGRPTMNPHPSPDGVWR